MTVSDYQRSNVEYDKRMYETFEHTADLGLRVCSPNLDALFAEAAEALFSVIVEDLATVRPAEKFELQLEGDDRSLLLFDWLNELLFRCDTGHWLYGRFMVSVSDAGITGVAWGEPLDRTRHQLSHEVKAITYHGLRLEESADGWLAEVIVDI